MVPSLEISASALSAQRIRMNAIASNIANANTTRDANGNNLPYKRLEVLFREDVDGDEGVGVQVASVRESADPYRWVHQPDHPDAIKDPQDPRYGQVQMPRINIVQEMVDMMLASRAYEANLTAMDLTKAIGSSISRIIA